VPLHLALGRPLGGLELVLVALVVVGTAGDRPEQPADSVAFVAVAFVVALETGMGAHGAVAHEPLHAKEVGAAKERRRLVGSGADQRGEELVRALDLGSGRLLTGTLPHQVILARDDSTFPAGHRRLLGV